MRSRHKVLTLKIEHFFLSSKFLYILSSVFLLVITYLYYRDAVSFSFIDEYNNFMAGYFLLSGKHLYTQIFFQHDMLMVYISALLQLFLKPSTLYQLVLEHRLFVLFFGLMFDIWLIYRFRFIALLFVFVFELWKYYLFGNLFLAEGLIVYPVVYLLFLNMLVINKEKLWKGEILFSGILTWFIIWMREPYVPLALVLYVMLLFLAKRKKESIYSLIFLFFMSFVIIMTTDIKSYILDVINVNYTSVAVGEIQRNGIAGIGILKVFFYPLFALMYGNWDKLRYFSILLSLFFIYLFICLIIKKQLLTAIYLIFLLGVANLRVEPPGVVYYQAYHMLIWYGLCIAMSAYLARYIYNNIKNKISILILIGVFVLINIALILSSGSYVLTNINRQLTFTVAYGRYYTFEKLINILSTPHQSLFVDSWDSLIYWKTDTKVAYPYLFYYPPMNAFQQFLRARTTMFKHNPPSFYYEYVGEIHTYSPSIPANLKTLYIPVYFNNGISGLYIYKPVLKTIRSEQWKQANQMGYYIKT